MKIVSARSLKALEGRIDMTTDLKSEDYMVRKIAETATAESDAIRACMSPKGSLNLPALLEKRRWAYGITDGAFKIQPIFDRIFVHQISEHGEMAGGQDGKIILTTIGERRDKEEAPMGILLAAGPTALDALASHGIELGHICSFLKISPYRYEVDRYQGKSFYMLVQQVGDLTGSIDLRADLRAGKVRMDYDAENREHIITDKKGKRWKPRKPFQGADF
jgi:hypothetical protein